MNDLDIAPPMAPGTQRRKKEGFFSRFFKKDVEEVRLTEESQEMDLDAIRKKAGIAEVANTEPAPTQAISTEPEDTEEPEFSLTEPLPATEPVPELPTETPENPEPNSSQLIEEHIDDSIEAPRFDVEAPLAEDNDAEQELAALEQEHEEWLQANETQETETPSEIEEPSSSWEEHKEGAPSVSSDWTEQEGSDEWMSSEAGSWTDDAISELETPGVKTPETPPAETPPHHEAVDAALAPIAKKHAAFDKELEKVAREIRADIPEWSYQRKEVKPDQYFTLKNGQEITSFKDLLDALSFIDDETFQHHVTEDRNDFAEWVQHILEEEKLAERIRNKKAREELLKILRTHERKIWKSLERESKKLQNKSKTHQKTSVKMKNLEEKLEKLKKELEEKSVSLQELRGTHATKIKKHIDAHVADRVDEERTEIRLDREVLGKKEATLTELEGGVAERESVLDGREKACAEKESSLDEERATFEQERDSAQELLSQGANIRAEKEEASRKLSEAEALFRKNDAVLRETTKQKGVIQRAQERLKEQKEKFATAKKEFMDLKKEVATHERALAKAENDAEKRVTKADEWHAQVLRERKEWQAEKKQELAELSGKRKEVESTMREAQQQTQAYEELVAEHENSMRRNEEVLSETERLREEIRQRQEAMESQSMQEYLRTKADTTVAGSTASNITPPVEEISNLHLYKLIDQCKSALGKNELGEARHVYNQLRDEFGQSKLSSHEKSVLYNSIRELYDDIHLAMLN